MSTINSQVSAEDIKELCDQILKYNYINPDDFNRFNVKRGLRNSDGTGVMAGISRVCSVEGYYISDGERIPKDEPSLSYPRRNYRAAHGSVRAACKRR